MMPDETITKLQRLIEVSGSNPLVIQDLLDAQYAITQSLKAEQQEADRLAAKDPYFLKHPLPKPPKKLGGVNPFKPFQN
jgi:hypothetical protein